MSSKNGTPEFDFSELSWGDDKVASEIQMKSLKAQQENDVEGFQSAVSLMEQYLAKVVTHVPREWLISSAPEQIDWSDTASYNYLRASKMIELRKAMEQAKQGN
jgi:hypothetical protein